MGFSGDDAHVWWFGDNPNGVGSWFASTIGGTPRLGVPNTLSVAWSRDGTRLAYHDGVGGDPIFVADRNGANPRQIFVDKAGRHNHYLAWSPDGRFIYFVRGIMDPWDMDIWRIPSQGGTVERLTNHHSRVADPTLLDERTLLYTADRPDASGSGLYVMDLDRRIPHAVTFGLEEYLSIAASADGRRLVATVANPTSHIWSAPISDRVADESAVTRVLSSRRACEGTEIRTRLFSVLVVQARRREAMEIPERLGDRAVERRRGPGRRGAGGIEGWHRICFVVREGGQNRLYVMAADGTGARRISDTLDARDARLLVSRRKVDRRRGRRRRGAAALQGPRRRRAGGAPDRRSQPQPGLVPGRTIHRLFRALCRTGVPAQGDHSGEGAIPDPGDSWSSTWGTDISSCRTANRWC